MADHDSTWTCSPVSRRVTHCSGPKRGVYSSLAMMKTSFRQINLPDRPSRTTHRGRLARQRASDVSLDGVELLAFLGRRKARGMSRRSSARRASDAMHVILDSVRQIIVDDPADAGHV